MELKNTVMEKGGGDVLSILKDPAMRAKAAAITPRRYWMDLQH